MVFSVGRPVVFMYSLVADRFIDDEGLSATGGNTTRKRIHARIPGRNYDFDPVAKRFLMVKEGPASARSTEIVVIENWAEEVKQRLADAEGN